MNADLFAADGRHVLRFERHLAHPPEKVWRAITEPEHLAQWFPAAVQGDRRLGARLQFVFDGDEAPPTEGEVVAFDPPRLLAFTWSGELLRFELHAEPPGCRLVFTHTFDDRAGAASFASGWQGCLDALATVLDGRPVAWPDQYAERHEAYVARFGLDAGTVTATDDGWIVRFERQLPYPLEAVWARLTESETTPSGERTPGPDDLAVGQAPPLPVTNGYVPAGPLTALEPKALLEYPWLDTGAPAGVVRWVFSNGPGGARVVLTQTGPSALADARVTALAAWHTHLEVLARHLGGDTRCWEPARTEQLMKQYATRA